LIATRTCSCAWGLRQTSRHSRTLVLGITCETQRAPTLQGKARVHEELASVREIVNLSPPQALDEAEHFLVAQGYVVVQRTVTTLTVEREDTEGTAAQEEAPKLAVMAVPEPNGGVRIKVRGNDREGVREWQARWSEWEASLPKRLPPPKVRTKVVKMGQSGRSLSRRKLGLRRCADRRVANVTMDDREPIQLLGESASMKRSGPIRASSKGKHKQLR
jgi:hypothetical protein